MTTENHGRTPRPIRAGAAPYVPPHQRKSQSAPPPQRTPPPSPQRTVPSSLQEEPVKDCFLVDLPEIRAGAAPYVPPHQILSQRTLPHQVSTFTQLSSILEGKPSKAEFGVVRISQPDESQKLIQSTFDTFPAQQGAILLSSQSSTLSQIMIRMAAASGVRSVWVARNGSVSTLAISAVVRERVGADGCKASGAIVLTSRFGIKYYMGNGGTAPDLITDRIHENTKKVKDCFLVDLPEVDITTIGVTTFEVEGRTFTVDVFDPPSDPVRHYFTRHDYDMSAGSAKRLMTYLVKLKDSLPTPNIVECEEFEYEEDGSIADYPGIRFLLEDGSRLVFCLSGSRSEVATICLYVEKYEKDPSKVTRESAEALAPLVKVALELSQLEKFTGQSAPTAIT